MSFTTVNCTNDLRLLFTRNQHHLNPMFDKIEGMESSWEDVIPDGGAFPLQTGYAARQTTLAQQRLNASQLNGWKPMVGLQADCETSCDPPNQMLNFGNAEQNWYYLMEQAFTSEPFCLEKLLSDPLSLPQQIEQFYRNLKFVTTDVKDEFYRGNYVFQAQNRWIGFDNGTVQEPRKQKWRFATDANGFVNTTYIILDQSIDPDYVTPISVDLLNYVRNAGVYNGAFPADGEIEVITDWPSFQQVPLYDTMRRADMRFREPGKSDPSYTGVSTYAGYKLHPDYFALRYYWTETEPGYPQGVLKRVFQWGNRQLTEGCMSEVSDSYLNADFQVNIPLPKFPVIDMQNGNAPTSFGNGANFTATASPWTGQWIWHNEVNEITPCNVDKNKAFWRAVWKMAARPRYGGIYGHTLLNRRFPQRGITRICKPLGAPTGGSYDCSNECPAFDFFPPALDEIWTCGGWGGNSCAS